MGAGVEIHLYGGALGEAGALAKGHRPKVRKAKGPKGAAPAPGKKGPPAKGKGKP